MDATTIVFIIVIGLVIACLLWWIEHKRQEARREAYRVWAQLHNWSYDFHRDRETYRYYSFLNRLQQGANRYAFDILEGTWGGYPAEAFNFHYETYSTSSSGYGSTTTTHHHYFGVVIIQIERSFPELMIFPQNLFGKIGSALGFGGIEFESVEFSNNFTVRCSNKKFAWDFCHPRMMDYLLSGGDIFLELEDNILVLYKMRGKMKPDEVEEYLIELCELRKLMPEYLFRI
ncbi:hypothetical protein HC931_01460 [Candidatus Gracilibacteria bacterium]|nr:hypothetical protein [Candidatus Gracilibacteria bacterium]NJM86369.1 hypothetical protein [Hydrococcus sp. RU_2_2]NJP19178.1 hypothetical protein [Hydrococcus sp. CRU_1_1]